MEICNVVVALLFCQISTALVFGLADDLKLGWKGLTAFLVFVFVLSYWISIG